MIQLDFTRNNMLRNSTNYMKHELKIQFKMMWHKTLKYNTKLLTVSIGNVFTHLCDTIE